MATLAALDPELPGIVICGSGIGVCISANKIPGARCALAYTKKAAKLSREHNNANILSLPGREKTVDDPVAIAKAFLTTKFSKAARHVRRIQEIGALEKKFSK